MSLWHLRLCERSVPSTWHVGGRPRSADTKFPFLSTKREWNRGKSVSKAGRGWIGKRPSLGCPGWLRFPAKVRCPRRSPCGLGRDAWPWEGSLRGRALDHRQPPGTWGPPRGSWRQGPAGAAPGRGGGWFWSSVLFRPQHSCPRLSHRGAPHPPLPACPGGHNLGFPILRPQGLHLK